MVSGILLTFALARFATAGKPGRTGSESADVNDDLIGYGARPIPDIESEIGVTIVEPSELDVCTWTDDVDEKRRAFVINQMACADIDGEQLVKNMHAVCEWLKAGSLPEKSDKPFDTKDLKVRMKVLT
jgi:hypothetical protein